MRPVRLFRSYREAELHGYYSLKCLRQMGLEVRSANTGTTCTWWRRRTGTSPSTPGSRQAGSVSPVPAVKKTFRRSTRSESRSFFPKRNRRQADVQPYVGKIAHRQDRQGRPDPRKRRGAPEDEPSPEAPGTSSTRRRTWTSPNPTRTRRTRSASSSTSSSRVSSSTGIRSKGSPTTTTPWARGSWAEGPRARRTSGSSTATC